VPRLPRKSGGDQMAPEGRQRDARAYDPLAMHVVPRLPRKSGGDQMAPAGRQRDARAYTRALAKAAKRNGTRGRPGSRNHSHHFPAGESFQQVAATSQAEECPAASQLVSCMPVTWLLQVTVNQSNTAASGTVSEGIRRSNRTQ
jgi:hypothetical protein